MSMTPEDTVKALDRRIISQYEAKRAVAIALRNRWRRIKISEENPELSEAITPKNILMIGPTGVGKTEIARQLAKLADAPFVKVEATKFTEVGYVGRDVDSIIRELADVAVKETRTKELEKVKIAAEAAAEERILDALLPKATPPENAFSADLNLIEAENSSDTAARTVFRNKFRQGELDDREIEIEVSAASIGVEIMAPPGMEEMTSQLQSMFQNMNSERKRSRKMKVKEAYKVLQEEEANKLMNDDEIKTLALRNLEQNGIVFIDEFDKICRRSDHTSGADVSREGVQRDLLPLIEGSTVSTKYGMIKTDHILFIASGAFHVAKPSDLIPELQGRLPIRVELKALSTEDFKRILTEPHASLTQQYVAMLGTENVKLHFTDDAIDKIAEIAWQVNETTENIGARRLYTVMERLLEKISFSSADKNGETITIDANYVKQELGKLAKDLDLSHYIL